MATVQRANVVLDIPDEPDVIQRYKDKGYNVIDSFTGTVIERAMPHEVGALQAMLLEYQDKIQAQASEIESLNQEIQKLKKKRTSKSAE